MKIVSCITARGGSKGIPRKNIIDLNGKPLLYYSMKASIDSNVDKTFVSTDDEDIFNMVLSHGVSVIDRPKKLADDVVMPDEALLHFSTLVDFDWIVFIHPTSPLIKPEYINKGIEMINTGKYDSVFSGTKEHWIPRWDEDVNPVDWDIHHRPRRQDKPELYIENGMFYITSRECLLSSGLRYSGTMGIVEIPLKDSFQVDSLEDLELIRKLL